MTVEFNVFTVINASRNAPMKEASGHNIFPKCITFGCVTVALRLDTFLILKNQSERQAIELLFKVQISPERTLSNTN